MRRAKSIGFLMDLHQKFDEGLTKSKPLSGRHTRPKTTEDIKLVVKELMSQEIFNVKDARQHSKFSNFTPLLHKVNRDKIVKWIHETSQHILHDQ